MMTPLTKSFTACLAVAFSTVAHGDNACLTGATSKCIEGITGLDLSSCSMTNDDNADLITCLDTVGRNDIITLRMQVNAMETFEPDTFKGMGSLVNLWLTRNALTALDAGIFDDLVSVVDMRLDSNQLTTVASGVFDNMGSVTALRMNGNNIATIEADAFLGMGSLINLFLYNNALTTLQAGIFDHLVSLQNLLLFDCGIEAIEVGAFTDLTSVSSLRLDNNQITTVDAGVFDNTGALADLWLNGNAITTIRPGSFGNLGSLGLLRLQDNGITTIHPGSFDGLTSLTDLFLQGNLLTTLPAGIFEDLGSGSSLSVLVLDRNAGLQCVPTVNSPFAGPLPATDDMCECTPAVAVTCDADLELCVPGAEGHTCVPACTGDDDCDTDNGEVCCLLSKLCEDPASIEAGACGQSACLTGPESRCIAGTVDLDLTSCGIVDADIPALKLCLDTVGRNDMTTLRLQGNELVIIEADTFKDMPSLINLWLFSNSLTTLNAGLFDGLVSLASLRLDSNELTTVAAGLFDDLVSIQGMQMHANNIATIDADAFQGLGSLLSLFLYENELTTLQAGFFDHLDSIRTLLLFDSGIQTIEADTFQTLPSLIDLRLDNNEITTLDAGTFDNLGDLEDLLLNGNALTTIGAGLFDNLGSLKILHLHNNDIEALEAGAFNGLASVEVLLLNNNELTTLPAGIFEDLGSGSSLNTLGLAGNSGLQCVPTVNSPFSGALPTTVEMCECTPAVAVTCEVDVEVCAPGVLGYTCVPACMGDNDCDTDNGEVCCLLSKVCEDPASIEAGACGQSACLTGPDSRCTAGTVDLDLTSCGIVDADIPALKLCLDTVGRNDMTTLRLQGNELVIIEADTFKDMPSLINLWLFSNSLTTLNAGLFDGLVSLASLRLDSNELTTVAAGLFDDLVSIQGMQMHANNIATIDADAFQGLGSLLSLFLYENELTTLQAGFFEHLDSIRTLLLFDSGIQTIEADTFQTLPSLIDLRLDNNEITTLDAGTFDNLGDLEDLLLNGNALTTIGAGLFDNLGSLKILHLHNNDIEALEAGAFNGLASVEVLLLNNNELTTLPAGIFEDLGSGSSLNTLGLSGNSGLQCVPTVNSPFSGALPTTVEMCECTPAVAVTCEVDVEVCAPGVLGYTCVPVCTDDNDCDTDNDEVCCPWTKVCEDSNEIDVGACGDPHMTGFRGQKFDFAGEDNGWYALVSDLPYMHLNMRVTSPVPSVPEITYITGLSIVTMDADGIEHTMIVSVADAHSLESSCPVGTSPCLADGALNVVVDGEEVLLTPGEVTVAPGVAIAAVNLPGECRSFGFEKYWERKKLEMLAQSGRRLSLINTMEDMSDWVLSDPTATNKVECAEYVARCTAGDGFDLFAKQSEHVSFQIMTPTAKIRLSHGRLHQLAMRDPTDQFDLPDHLTWQMNMAIDHHDMSLGAKGILGETQVPTVNETGGRIMQGMGAIRGKQEDYRVKRPVGTIFSQGQRRE